MDVNKKRKTELTYCVNISVEHVCLTVQRRYDRKRVATGWPSEYEGLGEVLKNWPNVLNN